MADNSHDVKIVVTGDTSDATSKFTGLKGVIGNTVNVLHGFRNTLNRVMNAFGLFGMAVNGVNSVLQGLKWLKDKLEETRKAAERLRFAFEMKSAEAETNRLVKSHERLSKLLKEELESMSQQSKIAEIRSIGKKDLEDGRREADRARQIYEAKTPEEEQRLRDRFEAEDERLTLAARKKARKEQIKSLDEEESVYTSKANAMRRNNADIDNQLEREDFNLRYRAKSDEDREPIRKRIEALQERKKANDAEIKELEREAKFRREQIAALEDIKDYEGPTAGEWQRKTEAKKRAEETARQEAETKAAAEKTAAREAARASEVRINEENRKKSEKVRELDAFAGRAASFDGVSQNRLTAMGLGSGVSAKGTVESNVGRIVKLMEAQIQATKDIKVEPAARAATYGE